MHRWLPAFSDVTGHTGGVPISRTLNLSLSRLKFYGNRCKYVRLRGKCGARTLRSCAPVNGAALEPVSLVVLRVELGDISENVPS